MFARGYTRCQLQFCTRMIPDYVSVVLCLPRIHQRRSEVIDFIREFGVIGANAHRHAGSAGEPNARCGPFMTVLAFALVLLAALTHASWNISAKFAAQSRHFVWLF